MEMETVTKIAKRKFPGAFLISTLCSKVYADLSNKDICFPRSSNLFECVDIVISHNTVLPSYLDQNNDHRIGYDFTAVYTYLTNVDGKLCRVAIIMCTRTVVGANEAKLLNTRYLGS